ncbi:hypothetical protein ZHAS_00019309 [Anopheles sinensis]|uniref:Uncharacterized protein n=1 Tax=Anopheles sinensis TaxID=74873 RepID=A0A084WM19_ANOSI|nr:hypothetical protein ZHAS_00019309 [Anopheles sinensis]
MDPSGRGKPGSELNNWQNGAKTIIISESKIFSQPVGMGRGRLLVQLFGQRLLFYGHQILITSARRWRVPMARGTGTPTGEEPGAGKDAVSTEREQKLNFICSK